MCPSRKYEHCTAERGREGGVKTYITLPGAKEQLRPPAARDPGRARGKGRAPNKGGTPQDLGAGGVEQGTEGLVHARDVPEVDGVQVAEDLQHHDETRCGVSGRELQPTSSRMSMGMPGKRLRSCGPMFFGV
jgi:hypothetical protein